MRLRGAVAIVSVVVLLMLLFTAFNMRGAGMGSIGEGGIGGLGRAVVKIRVELITESGARKPVEGAEVVVGLESRRTDQSGEAEISIPPGIYSSYIRVPDLKLAPLLTRLEVKEETRVDVLFELRRVYPSSVSLKSDGNSTRVVMEIEVPNDVYRAYMAEPVIGLFTGEGTYVAINQENAALNPFTSRIEPNATTSIENIVPGYMALLDAKNTYIPIELIRLRINGRN